MKTPAGCPHETLSDREYQVLCLIGSGKTVSQVAESLALSVKTVSTYRARILEKMHLEKQCRADSLRRSERPGGVMNDTA